MTDTTGGDLKGALTHGSPAVTARRYSTRCLLLLMTCGLLTAWPAGEVLANKSTRLAAPNVLVLLADDQGWGDLSINGNRNVATPNIDSLGRDGAYFERFYVCPVCSPTRAELLTGRYHPRGGVHSTSAGGERLNLNEMTIAQSFKAAGYATAAFGKWHNGSQYPYHPNARGFDEYYGFPSGHWGNYFDPLLEHNGRLVRGEGYIIDDLTDHAIAFVEQHRDRPFFCYVPYNVPHSPMQVPDRFYHKFESGDLTMRHREPDRENLAMTRAALAMTENVDWNIGRLLQRLEQLQLADRTIIVYFTHWTRPDDSITWDISVHTAGTYEALIHYACPSADTGATIQLEFGGVRIEKHLTEAHDPPLRGAENDRVPRAESLVKDFKPWLLGRLRLPAGRGPLTLTAPRIPGTTAMEVRMVELRLLASGADRR